MFFMRPKNARQLIFREKNKIKLNLPHLTDMDREPIMTIEPSNLLFQCPPWP